MSRFTITLGALGLSLVATAAFAHGGQGSMGGFQHATGMPVMLGNPMDASKVQGRTDHDPSRTGIDDRHDSGRDRHELAEKQRIKTELTTLETRAFLLTEKVQMLTAANGNPRDIARLTEEIRHLGNRIGMLQREEKAPA